MQILKKDRGKRLVICTPKAKGISDCLKPGKAEPNLKKNNVNNLNLLGTYAYHIFNKLKC